MALAFQYLADNPLIFLFLMIGIGMAVGHLKIRGISLGAAAVLFVAIIVSAWALANGVTLTIPHEVGSLGLAIFAYAIGITSGPNFFHVMKTSGTIVAATVLVLGLGAAVGLGIGKAFGLSIAQIAGTFAGAITNTPALAAAGAASGDPGSATVGYAVAYLFGVLGMLIFSMMALSYGKNDTDAPSPVVNHTIRIDRDDSPTIGEVKDVLGGSVMYSRLRRGELGPITNPKDTDRLSRNDLLTVVGPTAEVDAAIDYLGHLSSHSLLTDRRYLDFRRVTVSNPKLAGRTISELDLEATYSASISRVRRGDVDVVAEPDTILLLGDRARVVAPATKLDAISKFFGDSARGLSDINPVALGLGMALGLAIGALQFPLPGGGTFAIGSAAGALIVGLVMGRIGRIGSITTALPQTASAVLSELGLIIFLAYAGANAGGQIGVAFTSGAWLPILVTGVAITSTVGLGLYLVMRYVLKLGGTRLSGLLGGAQTQPAVLAFANMRSGSDPRVALGYAMVYPVAMIVKILLAQILGSL